MSHTYQNLVDRRMTVGQASKDCAKKVPLVHCIRGKTDVEALISLLKTGGFSNVSSSDATIEASNELGIPACSMYFYAGRAFPENGVLVSLLFGGAFEKDGQSIETIIENENSDPACRGARPFDSGGLVKQLLRLNNTASSESAKEYFDQHNISAMSEWRKYFSLFLNAFFADVKDYWEKCPAYSIDNVEFSADDDWRNWTFELHSRYNLPPVYAGKMFVAETVKRTIHAEVRSAPELADRIQAIMGFCADPRACADIASKDASI